VEDNNEEESCTKLDEDAVEAEGVDDKDEDDSDDDDDDDDDDETEDTSARILRNCRARLRIGSGSRCAPCTGCRIII
jgi:hypothetical protein